MICDHNICRECCIEACLQNKNKIRHSFFSVDCKTCGLSTVLDREDNTEIIFEVERRSKLNIQSDNESNLSNLQINQNESRISGNSSRFNHNANVNVVTSVKRDLPHINTHEIHDKEQNFYYNNSNQKHSSLSPLEPIPSHISKENHN